MNSLDMSFGINKGLESHLNTTAKKLYSIDDSTQKINKNFEKTNNQTKNLRSIIGGLSKPLVDAAKRLFSLNVSAQIFTLGKSFFELNKEIKSLADETGYGTKNTVEFIDKIFKIQTVSGVSTSAIKELNKELLLNRINLKEGALTSLAIFMDYTGASAEATGKFTASLIQLGATEKEINGVFRSIASVRTELGLTTEEITSLYSALPKMIGALGKTDINMQKVSKNMSIMISSFKSVGIAAEETIGIFEKLFNPDTILENSLLLNKLGISLNDAMSGKGLENINIYQDKFIELAKTINNIPNKFAANEMAKQYGITLEQANKLANMTTKQINNEKEILDIRMKVNTMFQKVQELANKTLGNIASKIINLFKNSGIGKFFEENTKKLSDSLTKINLEGIGDGIKKQLKASILAFSVMAIPIIIFLGKRIKKVFSKSFSLLTNTFAESLNNVFEKSHKREMILKEKRLKTELKHRKEILKNNPSVSSLPTKDFSEDLNNVFEKSHKREMTLKEKRLETELKHRKEIFKNNPSFSLLTNTFDEGLSDVFEKSHRKEMTLKEKRLETEIKHRKEILKNNPLYLAEKERAESIAKKYEDARGPIGRFVKSLAKVNSEMLDLKRYMEDPIDLRKHEKILKVMQDITLNNKHRIEQNIEIKKQLENQRSEVVDRIQELEKIAHEEGLSYFRTIELNKLQKVQAKLKISIGREQNKIEKIEINQKSEMEKLSNRMSKQQLFDLTKRLEKTKEIQEAEKAGFIARAKEYKDERKAMESVFSFNEQELDSQREMIKILEEKGKYLTPEDSLKIVNAKRRENEILKQNSELEKQIELNKVSQLDIQDRIREKSLETKKINEQIIDYTKKINNYYEKQIKAGSKFNGILERGKNMFVNIGTAIKDSVVSRWSKFTTNVKETFKDVGSLSRSIAKAGLTFLRQQDDKKRSALRGAGTVAVKIGSGLTKAIGKVAGITGILMAVFGKSAAMQRLFATVQAKLESVFVKLEPAMEALSKVFMNLFDMMMNSGIIDAVIQIIEKLTPVIIQLVEILLPPLLKILGFLVQAVGVLIKGIGGLIKVFGGKTLGESIQSMGDSLLDAGKVLKDAGESIKKANEENRPKTTQTDNGIIAGDSYFQASTKTQIQSISNEDKKFREKQLELAKMSNASLEKILNYSKENNDLVDTGNSIAIERTKEELTKRYGIRAVNIPGIS